MKRSLRLLITIICIVYGAVAHAQWTTSGTTNVVLSDPTKNVIVGTIPTTSTNLYLNSANPSTVFTIDNNFSAVPPAPTTHYVGINFNSAGTTKYKIYTSSMPVCPSGYFHVSPISGTGMHMNGNRIDFTDDAGLCATNRTVVPGSRYSFDSLASMNRLYVGGMSSTYPTLNPNYRLYVAGSMICEELVIKLKANWADYVFSPQYKLRPLSEVKTFITENKHLPDVPAACEVEESGVATGKMLTIQMRKIEELTLYLIQMEERIKELEAQNKVLNNPIQK
ncbi:MAG: hypothetical protein ACTHJT_09525 [Cytophaga sp.]|uniref:hypothetical protein n=1 Tax=Cytophaga sp. TaxID=29535 RepID=UPI003F7DA556